jgi:ABC-type dipeptide/oligopeptide/nickel transport system permease subunit
MGGNLRIILQHVALSVFATSRPNHYDDGNYDPVEAGLSFLGIGIIPPTLPGTAWFPMVVNTATNPILSVAPGVGIMLVVFSFNDW